MRPSTVFLSLLPVVALAVADPEAQPEPQNADTNSIINQANSLINSVGINGAGTAGLAAASSLYNAATRVASSELAALSTLYPPGVYSSIVQAANSYGSVASAVVASGVNSAKAGTVTAGASSGPASAAGSAATATTPMTAGTTKVSGDGPTTGSGSSASSTAGASSASKSGAAGHGIVAPFRGEAGSYVLVGAVVLGGVVIGGLL